MSRYWVSYIAAFVFWALPASPEYHGHVSFKGSPVPGAIVTATQGGHKAVSITDDQGFFTLPDLQDGVWTVVVEMQGFLTIKQDVLITADFQAPTWELTLLPMDQIKASTALSVVAPATVAVSDTPDSSGSTAAAPTGGEQAKPPGELAATLSSSDDFSRSAADGFLINGSVNNGAASPFAQLAAFGNARNAGKGLYHGGIGFRLDNSALNARPFSLSGQNTPKAAYNRVTGTATLGGPFFPHGSRHGPNFFVSYQWTRDRDDAVQSALVPDLAERQGDFSHELNLQGQPVQIFNPATGLPFPGNLVPVSPQAQALMNLYPLPNVADNPKYNFQTPIINNTHQDSLQSRIDKLIDQNDEVYGGFGFQSTRTASPNLFDFVDNASALGLNTYINWSHNFSRRVAITLGYRFNRLSTKVAPFWTNRANVSGEAGINGNNQDPINWGPPTLVFSGGVASLSDQRSSFDRNQGNGVSATLSWNHNHHNFTFGGEFRRQEFNYFSQQNPRGTVTFTGAATAIQNKGVLVGGSDVADFLLGIPDASAIAFGNADKYFRESVYNAYVTDDWRVNPQLSVNVGARWEYSAPITELLGRLVNLDSLPGFSAVAPVVASNPVGSLTGQQYPSSLIEPDKSLVEPRLGVAWRPIAGSSLVIRGGYGIYSDTSIYQILALQMAQQAPLSKSLNLQNSTACPLTLANPFTVCPSTTQSTFGVAPNFRVGYAQNWMVSLQRDLPGSLQLTALYLGIKGSDGLQEFLPNTFPLGAVNPCPACPVGFVEAISGGNSTREEGQLQLRRRLHNGLTAVVQYTFSKSIDDDAILGGYGTGSSTQNSQLFSTGFSEASTNNQRTPMIAQNWLALQAERGPSIFDQRHVLNAQVQYTTGMGLGGGTLMTGWKRTLFSGWTFLTQVSVGSGLPETPIFLAPLPSTGFTGILRPELTGVPVSATPPGLFLNPAAYSTPPTGQFGNAGRNSILGPMVFNLNGSIGHSFLLEGRFNLDLRMDAVNLLNKVTFTAWNTTVNSSQFGLPIGANSMRNIVFRANLRF